jgi:hypothetical protein
MLSAEASWLPKCFGSRGYVCAVSVFANDQHFKVLPLMQECHQWLSCRTRDRIRSCMTGQERFGAVRCLGVCARGDQQPRTHDAGHRRLVYPEDRPLVPPENAVSRTNFVGFVVSVDTFARTSLYSDVRRIPRLPGVSFRQTFMSRICSASACFQCRSLSMSSTRKKATATICLPLLSDSSNQVTI